MHQCKLKCIKNKQKVVVLLLPEFGKGQVFFCSFSPFWYICTKRATYGARIISVQIIHTVPVILYEVEELSWPELGLFMLLAGLAHVLFTI